MKPIYDLNPKYHYDSYFAEDTFLENETCLGVECRSIFASRQNFATIEDDSFAVFGVKKPLI